MCVDAFHCESGLHTVWVNTNNASGSLTMHPYDYVDELQQNKKCDRAVKLTAVVTVTLLFRFPEIQDRLTSLTAIKARFILHLMRGIRRYLS